MKKEFTSNMKTQSFVEDSARRDLEANSKISSVSQKPNPIWKYFGFGENFRPKLPSRNWTIFLAIVGSFTTAVIFDKREKKRNQLKWCKLVEHISKQPLDSLSMPRKLTVYLEAPPKDGLRSAQDHFKDYVKPILVASGLDWEFVQGRKEGDIREKVVDLIRCSRLSEEIKAEKDEISRYRLKNGIKEFEGQGGDIVIGRHTWKEYVRGLHDGWLGPTTRPVEVVPDTQGEGLETGSSDTSSGNSLEDKIIPPVSKTETGASESSQKSTKSITRIDPVLYPTLPIPDDIPNELQPSIPICFPHILGFLNTPRRIYRFLHRRELADTIGRETAAVILSKCRPYRSIGGESHRSDFSNEGLLQTDNAEQNIPMKAEQQVALQNEESDWQKSVWVEENEESERIWPYPIVLDQRIASRMRRFELSADDMERAETISVTEEEVEGQIKGNVRKILRAGKVYFGRNQVFEAITDRKE